VKLKEEFQEKAKKVFNEELKDILKNNDGSIEEVVWTQYVPYFNDGDACEFSVNEAVLKLKDSEYDEGNCYYDLYDQTLSKKQELILDNVNELILSNTLEDALKDMFGEHSLVKYIVKTGKFEVEDWDHD